MSEITPNDYASNVNGKQPKSVVREHFSVCEDKRIRSSADIALSTRNSLILPNGGTEELKI